MAVVVPSPVTVADLGVYLQMVDSIDTARAQLMLDLAYDKCSTLVSPVPDAARGIILEVAARAYTNVTSAHQMGLGTAQISYGSQNSNTGIGGMYLSKANERELRRLAGRSGAFTVDPTPTDAGTGLQPWDSNVTWLNGVPLAEDFRP